MTKWLPSYHLDAHPQPQNFSLPTAIITFPHSTQSPLSLEVPNKATDFTPRESDAKKKIMESARNGESPTLLTAEQ